LHVAYRVGSACYLDFGADPVSSSLQFGFTDPTGYADFFEETSLVCGLVCGAGLRDAAYGPRSGKSWPDECPCSPRPWLEYAADPGEEVPSVAAGGLP
jgi:hypothetical protein